MKISLIFLLFILVCSCEKSNDVPKYSAPSDHNVNKHGTLHKSGLEQASTNCVSCHGSDLKGGSAGVSCFECHGKEWK